MAIKITGTTVINDSRELENINNAADFVKSANFVNPPQLFIDGELQGLIDSTPTLTTSEFSIFGGGSDTHDSTDWEVIRTSDSTTVFSSIGDTTNLTSIDVSPDLDNNEEYLVRVRHNGTSLGASQYREVTITTFDPATAFIGASLGDSVQGGFYMGTICAAGTCYYLVVAPNATGCACCQWKTSQSSTSGTCSDTDGYANTYPALENSTHPAGNWTATRTIDGFSDWYLPAIDELEAFFNNGGGNGSGDPLPSGEDFCTNSYWSSTERADNFTGYACIFDFGSCCRDNRGKTFTNRVRAVRRVPI